MTKEKNLPRHLFFCFAFLFILCNLTVTFGQPLPPAAQEAINKGPRWESRWCRYRISIENRTRQPYRQNHPYDGVSAFHRKDCPTRSP